MHSNFLRPTGSFMDNSHIRKYFFTFLGVLVLVVTIVCIIRIANIYLDPSANHPSLHMPKSLGGPLWQTILRLISFLWYALDWLSYGYLLTPYLDLFSKAYNLYEERLIMNIMECYQNTICQLSKRFGSITWTDFSGLRIDGSNYSFINVDSVAATKTLKTD